jgi:hypothetical protein
MIHSRFRPQSSHRIAASSLAKRGRSSAKPSLAAAIARHFRGQIMPEELRPRCRMVEPVQVAVNRADGVHPSLLLCRHFARLLIQLRHPDSLGAGVFGDFSGVAVAIGPSFPYCRMRRMPCRVQRFHNALANPFAAGPIPAILAVFHKPHYIIWCPFSQQNHGTHRQGNTRHD